MWVSNLAGRVWTGSDEARPRVSDLGTTVPSSTHLSLLPGAALLGAPSDHLPLVPQVLRVGGGGVAALGTVRVAESPGQSLEEAAGGPHSPQFI